MKIFFSASDSAAGKGIRLFEGSDYSHTGFVMPDGRLLHSTGKFGVHYSNSAADFAASCTRFDVFDIIVPNEKAGIEFLEAQVGKPYDNWAIIGFLFWRDWSEEDKWYCSELLAKWFAVVGFPILGSEHYNRIPVRLVLGITNGLAESQKLLMP